MRLLNVGRFDHMDHFIFAGILVFAIYEDFTKVWFKVLEMF